MLAGAYVPQRKICGTSDSISRYRRISGRFMPLLDTFGPANLLRRQQRSRLSRCFMYISNRTRADGNAVFVVAQGGLRDVELLRRLEERAASAKQQGRYREQGLKHRRPFFGPFARALCASRGRDASLKSPSNSLNAMPTLGPMLTPVFDSSWGPLLAPGSGPA